jgi:hypothetical protein
MSKIDTMIQQLQEKKKKLDYLDYIKDLLTGDQKCVDFVEVQEEVLTKLVPLIDQLSTEIEDSVEAPAQSVTLTGQFSESELKSLKLIASKVAEKTSTPSEPVRKSETQQTKTTMLPPQDKMNFAMNNRHLSNKKVRVLHKDSTEVVTTGTVVGLDAPNVIVKTIEGHTIEVPVTKILLGETA